MQTRDPTTCGACATARGRVAPGAAARAHRLPAVPRALAAPAAPAALAAPAPHHPSLRTQ